MWLESINTKEDMTVSQKEWFSCRILARKWFQVEEIFNDVREFFWLWKWGYDEDLVREIEKFQKNEGFEKKYIDGILGQDTLVAMIKKDKNEILWSSDWTNKWILFFWREENWVPVNFNMEFEIIELKNEIEEWGNIIPEFISEEE